MLHVRTPYSALHNKCQGKLCNAAITLTALEPYSTKPPPNLPLAHQQPDEEDDCSQMASCTAAPVRPPAGMTEAEVRKAGSKALVAIYPMSSVGRARERGETQGFMKVLVDAESRKILGVGILGIGGDEVVHAFLDVMYAGAPYTVITRATHIHPTVA